MDKTRLVLVTGFLGAGKTTLMQSLLDVSETRKVGVIVNEFGSVNVDGTLLRRDGIVMKELTNGSIFCACIREDFAASLIALSGMGLEDVFVEASGLADPSNMQRILDGIGNGTERRYDYAGAICVVDSENFLALVELLPALERQVAYSGIVVLNKADLAPPETIAAAAEVIGRINPAARMIITSFCGFDIAGALAVLSPSAREPEETGNTLESRPATLVLRSSVVLPHAGLEAFLKRIAKDTYRIKGFADTDAGTWMITATGPHIGLAPWSGSVSGTEIVAISAVGIRLVSAVAEAIEAELKGMLHF